MTSNASMLSLITKWSLEEQREEYELLQLGQEIKHELKVENELNSALEAMTLKFSEAKHKLQHIEGTKKVHRQNHKNERKTLNEHKMVANKDFCEQIKRGQSKVREFEKDLIQRNETFQKWQNESQTMIAKERQLRTENKALNAELSQYSQQTIADNSKFEALQSEIERKRENILKNNNTKQGFITEIEQRKPEIKAVKERIAVLDIKMKSKQNEIANEKSNIFDLTNKIAILRDFKVIKSEFDFEEIDINKVKSENEKLVQNIEILQTQIEEMYEEIENFQEMNLYKIQFQINKLEIDFKNVTNESAIFETQIKGLNSELNEINSKLSEKMNELKSEMEKGAILKRQISEKERELSEYNSRIKSETLKLSEIRDKIAKSQLKQPNSIKDKLDYLSKYINTKAANLNWNSTEMKRDFSIESKASIDYTSNELTELEMKLGQKSKKCQILSERLSEIKCNKTKPINLKTNELKQCDLRLQNEINELIAQKQKLFSELSEINDIKMEESKMKRENLLKHNRFIEDKMNAQIAQHKSEMSALLKKEKEIIQKIDDLHMSQMKVKSPIVAKLDQISKNNIDAIHALKMELNEEKMEYQHLKVQLRQMQRAMNE